MVIVYILIGFIIGAVIMFLWTKSRNNGELNKLNNELSVLKNQLETERAAADKELNATKEYAAKELQSAQEAAQKDLDTARQAAEDRIKNIQEAARQQLESERTHAQELRQELEKKNADSLKLMQEEVRNLGERMLNEHRDKLNSADKERLDALLTPLKERIEAFSKEVADNSKESNNSKTEIKNAFENVLKQLKADQDNTVKTIREDQERAIKALAEQTERIGNDAASLTKALKGDSKMQGDWGEMILEETLSNCGLVKGEQYFLQANYKDEDNNNLRPDAVVVFPNKENVVIDSKVSLVAYQAAVNEEDDTLREQYLKEHVKAIKAHVDELSKKDYEKIVPNCIGYVLMFIPYESGYSAAIKTDPSILQYAYQKKIIILSPSNLLMSLQLTRTMWTNFRMNKNVEEILRQCNNLYDKIVGFTDTLRNIGKAIDTAKDRYDAAYGQFFSGKGNVVSRLENMKQLGISPKKDIKGIEKE